MNKASTRIPAFLLALIAIPEWFALVSQFYLLLQNRVASVAESIVRYFSFFTILTNIIVALCATFLLLKPNSKPGHFFSKPSTLTAVTVYIMIVALVYNFILRFLWKPQGLQLLVDELLHTIIPLLFVVLWILYVRKQDLKYKNAFQWLVYPVIYIIYTAARGAMTGYYPYPFVDVTKLGYSRVIINSIGLFAAFLGLSLFLIAVGKYRSSKTG